MRYDTPEWVAWFAGILDGEGSITIGRFAKRPLQKYRRDVSYHGVIQLSNTNRHLMERAADVIEAITDRRPKFYSLKRFEGNPRHRPAWMMAISAQWALLLVLTAVRPYLVAKGEQADLAITFARRHTNQTRRWRTAQAFEADEVDYARCRLLNRRGGDDAEEIAGLERMVTTDPSPQLPLEGTDNVPD